MVLQIYSLNRVILKREKIFSKAVYDSFPVFNTKQMSPYKLTLKKTLRCKLSCYKQVVTMLLLAYFYGVLLCKYIYQETVLFAIIASLKISYLTTKKQEWGNLRKGRY